MKPIDEADASRRAFVLSTGGWFTAAWLGAAWADIAAAAEHAGMAAGSMGAGGADDMAAADIAAAPAWTGFQFLTPSEAADVDAIAANIVPSGATPGAREAHAVYFVDRALATFFAAWAPEYRTGLNDFQTEFAKRSAGTSSAGTPFATATPEVQIAHLHTVDSTPFFDTTRMLTLIGMLAAPRYGGNVAGAGWQMVGFEDRHAFAPPFGYYDAHYTGFAGYPGFAGYRVPDSSSSNSESASPSSVSSPIS